MKILYVGAEVMPFAATGGLGDVLGSLPAAMVSVPGGDDKKSGKNNKQDNEKNDIRVILPLYGDISDNWREQMTDIDAFTVNLAWRRQYCGIKSLTKDGVIYYFIDNEYYFKRNKLYGHFDDGERYAFYCLAVLEALRQINWYPDVLHANDWQGAMSVVYLNVKYKPFYENYRNIKTVYTIHNIEYQGKYDFYILGDVFALGEEHHSLMEYGGCINLMKAAIECADRVTTVSPRYAKEIQTEQYSHGLHYILSRNSHKLSGILNGIDYNYYNPQTDKALAANYSYRSIDKKYENKAALQKAVDLPQNADVPLIAIISRLASHKGLDLVADIAYRLMEKDIQLVILGMGEHKYEDFFRNLQASFPDKVRALIEYDRDRSRQIYAAADIFVMPSKSEPCGLSQMIASRYGAIPVVRETGGLYDSIKGYWEKDGKLHGNGFTFANYSSAELLDRIYACLALYKDTDKREKFIAKIMKTDFSWKQSAEKYTALYEELINK